MTDKAASKEATENSVENGLKKRTNMAFAIIASKPGGREVLRKIDIDMPVPSATDVLNRQTAIDVNFIDVYPNVAKAGGIRAKAPRVTP